VRLHNPIVEVSLPMVIDDRIRTTGELGTPIIEQSLIIETRAGLIVLTGCAHPGIVNIVRQVRQWGPVDLVIGGFHLLDASPADVASVMQDLQTLGVRRVAPTHCTGEPAIAQFRAAFADNFIEAGAGTVIVLAP
jgi:7,8-dihydropterin-6-yl-methyl-4-(beta-D-ribofuranosyl)aminobenzene 5'-phosphate synthase